MVKKWFSAERIVTLLRQIEVMMAQGKLGSSHMPYCYKDRIHKSAIVYAGKDAAQNA